MEEKNLDADQSIELIQQMIRGTRQRLSFGSSNLFLLWGYLLAATAIVIFVLLKTTDCRTWLWLWLPAATTGGVVTWWHNRFRAPQVKSYTDRLLEQIWSCIASLVVLSAILICGYDPWAVDPLFPALLLIGAGLFISRGDPQQIHVLRVMHRRTDRLRHYPRLVAQCRPRLQPAAIRRSDPHRAHGCRLCTQAAGKARCGQSGEIKRRA